MPDPNKPELLRAVLAPWLDHAKQVGDRALANRGLPTQEEALPAEAPGVHLEKPNIVVQESVMFCWAAAGSSWLDVVYGRTRTQEQLVKSYANAPGGGLNSWNAKTDRPSPSFLRFADELKFSFEKMPGRRLTADLIAAKLKGNGHLLLFFNLTPGGDAHTVVIYGINHPGGKGLLSLDVMDPDRGRRGVRPLEEFQSKNLLILGWPK
jgi:hypothetical protein